MTLLPLERLKRGESGTVADVTGNQQWVCRLHEMGVRAGVRLTVLQTGSPTLLQIGSGRLSLRLGDAIRILVRTANGCPDETVLSQADASK
jgi:Fe2+ transport system protein FeoA